MNVLSFSWNLKETNAHTSFFLSRVFFSRFFNFWKSYICEPRCVENTLAHTHIGASCLVMAHTKCACVFLFCFLKKQKARAWWWWANIPLANLQAYNFASHYSWKLQIYQNWNLFRLYHGGSTHRPLVTQICKVIALDNFNSFSIHKTTTFKFHHYCQRKHETCDQTLAPIDFNVFKILIWCYFPKHCASFCVLTLAQCFNQTQHRNPLTSLPYKHYHRSCLLHCFLWLYFS
jgi:hypothetical protein